MNDWDILSRGLCGQCKCGGVLFFFFFLFSRWSHSSHSGSCISDPPFSSYHHNAHAFPPPATMFAALFMMLNKFLHIMILLVIISQLVILLCLTMRNLLLRGLQMHLLCCSSCSLHPLQLNHIDNIHDEVLYSFSGFHVNFCHACPQGLCQVFLLFLWDQDHGNLQRKTNEFENNNV